MCVTMCVYMSRMCACVCLCVSTEQKTIIKLSHLEHTVDGNKDSKVALGGSSDGGVEMKLQNARQMNILMIYMCIYMIYK